MIVVRYADDIVVGFEHRVEAERFSELSFKNVSPSSVWNFMRARRG